MLDGETRTDEGPPFSVLRLEQFVVFPSDAETIDDELPLPTATGVKKTPEVEPDESNDAKGAYVADGLKEPGLEALGSHTRTELIDNIPLSGVPPVW